MTNGDSFKRRCSGVVPSSNGAVELSNNVLTVADRTWAHYCRPPPAARGGEMDNGVYR